mmetsp:Transcript_1994/g.2492  ORF Transcript_1994/g.2492 Transcript_1994/m.2492 type:complete len:188 (-) Transcript_1994:222-785(-)|eukprot:CAMPEP_0172518048 /NCGR_PEP_ID=MMETSP1066-20121228/290117_1 /TAXON_ID=671091 /ORGANISM="Coscinodiscus wailesii, Strain CCMP2513" /LENGTH=187 /DNA_ID=CAMNT_0013300335 /DNA_START=106 /DNA_END=669 /DNA_ORIENTATION=-
MYEVFRVDIDLAKNKSENQRAEIIPTRLPPPCYTKKQHIHQHQQQRQQQKKQKHKQQRRVRFANVLTIDVKIFPRINEDEKDDFFWNRNDLIRFRNEAFNEAMSPIKLEKDTNTLVYEKIAQGLYERRLVSVLILCLALVIVLFFLGRILTLPDNPVVNDSPASFEQSVEGRTGFHGVRIRKKNPDT